MVYEDLISLVSCCIDKPAATTKSPLGIRYAMICVTLGSPLQYCCSFLLARSVGKEVKFQV